MSIPMAKLYGFTSAKGNKISDFYKKIVHFYVAGKQETYVFHLTIYLFSL